VPRPGSAESGKVLSYSDSLGAMVWASPGTGSGGVSAVDKSSFVEGTDSFTPIGGVYNETPAGDPTEDQTAVVRITGKRALHLNLRTAAGVEIGTSGSPVRTDTTGTTSQPVSAASLPLPAGAATETTLAGVKTGTDKIPTTPASEHTTAVSPHAARLTDGAAFYKSTTPADTQPVSAASLPLPSGAAQEHVTAGSPHASRLTDGTSFYKSTTPADTQPVSAASLPLPSGAAQEHVTAGSPHAARLTDGTSFYKGTTPADTQPVTMTQASGSATLASAGLTAQVAMNGLSAWSIQLGGTWVGTVQFEGSTDGGTTWWAIPARPSGGTVYTFNSTANGLFRGGAADLSHVRANVLALSSGSVVVTVRAGAHTNGVDIMSVVPVVGDVIHGATNSTATVQVGGMAADPRALPTAVTAGQRVRQTFDLQGVQVFRRRRLASFTALFRLASRPYSLSSTFGAAGRKQYATIFHGAAATKTVIIRQVEVQLRSISAAAICTMEIVRLTGATTPATGNPAITPTANNTLDSPEVTCLALPTTAGTEGTVMHQVQYETAAVTPAVSSTMPPVDIPWRILYQDNIADDEQGLVIRAGVAEGWAIVVDSNAAVTVQASVQCRFTEE
jgi:hypothetical protein